MSRATSVFVSQDDRRDERNGRGGNGLFPCVYIYRSFVCWNNMENMKESHSLTKRHINHFSSLNGAHASCKSFPWQILPGREEHRLRERREVRKAAEQNEGHHVNPHRWLNDSAGLILW